MSSRHFFPAMLLVGIATTACASELYQPRGVYSQAFERRAYDTGRRVGFERGRDDVGRRRDFSLERHREYRDADQGYDRRAGSKEFYQRSFRQGFQVGYAEAFDQSGRRAAPPRVYESRAVQVGYRDGFDTGQNDARNRRRFNPTSSGRYRSADHDYERRDGSKDAYRRDYRAGFTRGYEDGFRGGNRRY